MNKFLWTLTLLLILLLAPVRILAQSCPDVQDNPCNSDDTECLQNIINSCHNEANTLTGQINYMDNQMKLTSIRIGAAQKKINTLLDEINKLENEVVRLESILNDRLSLLVKRIPVSYKRAATPDFATIFLSKNFFDFLTRIKYLQAVQKEDAALVFQVKATQNSYNESKKIREDKKIQLEQEQKQLEAQKQQLAQQKQAKDAVLAQTKGLEANYSKLRADALARLASFASFTQGVGLLSGQTSCDGWGCYYSQRDAQWGNALINGQNSGCGYNNGPCSIVRVGCLITSVAMMASHLGHKDISPMDIAFSTPFNFSVGTADLMKGTISVKGYNITRTQVASSLNPDLLQSGPVIVGMFVPSGTHFVVIKSYSDGKYMMNDPVTENGHDKSFTDYYSLGNIYEVDRVSM